MICLIMMKKEIICTIWTKEGKQEFTQIQNIDFERVKLHRLDGPAIEFASGTKYWYIDGKLLDTEEVETWLEENKIDLKEPEGQMAFKLRWM